MTNTARSTHKAGSTAMKDSLTIGGVLLVIVIAYFAYQMSQATDQHVHNQEAFHPELSGGNMDQAMASMANLPEDHETLVMMGNQHMDQQKFAMAAELYKRALAKKEVNDVRVDFGACLNGMNLPLRAIQEFQTVLAVDPTHGIATFNVGIVYSSQQQPDSARVYFQRYLELDPHGPAAATARAQLQRLGG
ncbi:MAG: tetratricopeptide repeat protein [candidate division Zixibacteria bacterium]|nr:tetratricopeptide repeat protein [candidate division Zixibacteria bacterium]MDH3938251.1 tetratricopeptide repeat protein [candidate division Zixibacteria bacterium]MDH4034523.1 tetratricopeptide repeat protein [candidate division Zixibacteria bacterium]